MQGPGALDGADDVVAALDDDARNVPDARGLCEELAFADEATVYEVMALDAGEGFGELVLAVVVDHALVEEKTGGAALPDAPGPGGFAAHGGIAGGEALVIGAHEVVALGLRD